MNKVENIKINIDNMIQAKQFGIAYRKGEFLLIFNSTNKDLSDGIAFKLPAKQLKKIADVIQRSGIEYQQEFSQDIGFTEE